MLSCSCKLRNCFVVAFDNLISLLPEAVHYKLHKKNNLNIPVLVHN